MIGILFARDHASGEYEHLEERGAAGPGEMAPRSSVLVLAFLIS